jgi:hypothetical protein
MCVLCVYKRGREREGERVRVLCGGTGYTTGDRCHSLQSACCFFTSLGVWKAEGLCKRTCVCVLRLTHMLAWWTCVSECAVVCMNVCMCAFMCVVCVNDE